MEKLIVPYKVWHIPSDLRRRPGTKIKPTSITIHNTANPTSTAVNERNWLINTYNKEDASWHLVVDENEVIEAIPLDEMAWHSGTYSGNNTSIGIEICESGDQEVVYRNAVNLVALLMLKYNFTIKQIVTHKYWSGKYCPRLLLPKWDKFIKDVEEEFNQINKVIIPDWKKDGVIYLNNNGLLHDFEGWLEKIDENIPVWASMALIARVHKDIKGGK